MTRLLTCGWETGDISEAGTHPAIPANSTVTFVSTVPTPRAGVYAMKVATSASSLSAWAKVFLLPAAKTDIWLRFGFFVHAASTSGTTEMPLIEVQNSGASVQGQITWNAADGLMRAYRGTTTGTLLGTSTTPLAQDVWHTIELRYQITSLTAGTVEVWLDGNRQINFSGDNTNASSLPDVQTIRLGTMSSVTAVANQTYVAFDDIAINDTLGTLNNGRAGDGRVLLLAPNGAGSSTQLARGGTDTGANYSQVNETPPSMTQYVGSANVGDRDLYTMSDISGVVVQSVNVVEELLLAQNSDSTGGSIAPTIKSGATINEATAVALATGAAYFLARWETDPNTGAAWTATAINALEAGATVR